MKPKVVRRDAFLVAGYGFFGDPFVSSAAWTEENEIGKLWKRFTGFCVDRAEEIPPTSIPGIGYEFHIWNQDVLETGHYEVFVGIEVKDVVNLPVDLSVKSIPARKYAMFTLAGELIEKELSAEMAEWLAAAGLKQVGTFIFNLYDERYKGTQNHPDSEIEVYVPVE